MKKIADTLRMAEKLLRSNRYLAEADMCVETVKHLDGYQGTVDALLAMAVDLDAEADLLERQIANKDLPNGFHAGPSDVTKIRLDAATIRTAAWHLGS